MEEWKCVCAYPGLLRKDISQAFDVSSVYDAVYICSAHSAITQLGHKNNMHVY